jgi:S-DNA-T family DNA segregation ATPase FtsK/SpoIIIE
LPRPKAVPAKSKSSHTSKPVKKVTPTRRSPSAQGRPSGAARSGRSTSLPSSPARRTTARSTPPLLGVDRISPERKIDLVGIVLALVGLLTLLSLISSTRSSLTGWWVGALGFLVGWGTYVLPVALLVTGAWLILRHIERLPQVSLERLVGLGLLFVNLLAWLHLLIGSDMKLAQSGQGGGVIGGAISQALVAALGLAGGVLILAAWFLIGLVFTVDLSVADVFRWLKPVLARLRLAWTTYWANRQKAVAQPVEVEENHTLPENFTRLPRTEPRGSDGSAVQPESPAPTVTTISGTTAPVWSLPAIEAILDVEKPMQIDSTNDDTRARLIEETLSSFGAPSHVVEIHRGPTITQFGVEPDFTETRNGRMRVRVSKIVALADDLALALAAQRIRIQAPVPGRAYVGIEVPNQQISRVSLREIIESESFQKSRSPLRFGLGKDVAGAPVTTDLTAMPHLLIAGTTGSGKSVCVNAILTCLLLNNTPDDLRLILIDPKRVELTGYNGVPHLLAPVVVDAERVVGALQWMMREMDNRYHKFAAAGARNIVDYNNRLQAKGEKRIPYLVIVIDELADLMMLAPDETERTITRLAQLARSTGLHLIIATQRPSVDVLTGLIKANFPSRIAFAVASGVDSRVILDQPGAERLLGRGDMLFQAPDAPAPVRLQGAYVSEIEIQRLVEYWRRFAVQAETPPGPPVDAPPAGVPLKQAPLWDDMAPAEQGDVLLKEATDLVRREGRASISMLQRKLRIGYTRAARIIDTLEEKGVIGSMQTNTQVREVLDYGPAAPPKEE